MSRVTTLIILGCVLAAGLLSPTRPVAAAPAASPSDWPSLNYDAAQSNYNAAERSLSARNVLKLRVKRWPAILTTDQSYPIVAAGRLYVPFLAHNRVHVRAIDLTTGKPVATYPKDALGGLLYDGGNLYLAGHILQVVDPASGDKLAQIAATPPVRNSAFVYPLADHGIVLAGLAGGASSKLYAVSATTNHVLRTLQSSSAIGAVISGHVVTAVSTGSAFYDESNGRQLMRQPLVGSDWFAGSELAYSVAPARSGRATLVAYDGTGHRAWGRTVGPVLSTQNADWPHAVGPNAVYVQVLSPRTGVEALDPLTGKPLWTAPIPFVQRIALVNDVLLVLTYSLGQPVKLVAVRPQSGKIIGAIVLSSGYYAFGAANELMAANGMVFIRVTGPTGPQIVALGL
ncbi:MAG TPA: PQQ-binding-like beta-propeller repeat protein [Chloroflexota bacterium]|nr:PQQ-binding-like beta-propeller repeat protein [Chloroflexota bacterium]